MANFLITGASSGLGAALASNLPEAGDQVWLISRRRPTALDQSDGVRRTWIECDLRIPESSMLAKRAVGEHSVDMLVHSAGIWETRGRLEDVPTHEFFNIMAVNVASFLAIVSSVSACLRQAERGWVVGIGSIAGLENGAGRGAAYAASKFGLRGAVHGLREVFRDSKVAAMCLSIGSLAPEPRSPEDTRIPSADVVRLLRLLPTLSATTLVKDISMPAVSDERV